MVIRPAQMSVVLPGRLPVVRGAGENAPQAASVHPKQGRGPVVVPAPRRPGSSALQARLFDEEWVLVRLAGELHESLAAGLEAAVKTVELGPARREALRGVHVLLEHEQRDRLALHFLGGPRPKKSTDQAFRSFDGPTKDAEFTVGKLKAIFRKSETNRLLVYVHERLRIPLSQALRLHPNPQTVAWALQAIEALPAERRGELIYQLLAQEGKIAPETPADRPMEIQLANDAVDVLAASQGIPIPRVELSADIRTERVAHQLRFLTRTEAWRSADESLQQGIVGEALRRAELLEK